MKPKASKAIPIVAGLIVLILLVGFALGLKTVIDFDPRTDQIRTTRYIYLVLPIGSKTVPTWIAQPDQSTTTTTTTPDWQRMHTFHQSAAGSTIEHSRWGSIADTLVSWDKLDLDEQAKLTLASRTRSLITSDRPLKSIRLYMLRIDARLVYLLDPIEHPDRDPMTSDELDALFQTALEEPLED